MRPHPQANNVAILFELSILEMTKIRKSYWVRPSGLYLEQQHPLITVIAHNYRSATRNRTLPRGALISDPCFCCDRNRGVKRYSNDLKEETSEKNREVRNAPLQCVTLWV